MMGKYRPTILIAEDAELVGTVCKVILERAGYSVIQAKDGPSAVAKYQENAPDAVLLDLAMPALQDGLTTLKEIRQLDPEAQVAIVTGAASREEVMAAAGEGVREFIAKPFDSARLLAVVTKLCGQRPL